jgi:hypothetical protein
MDAHGSGNYVDSGETPTKVEIELHRRNPHRSGEVFARGHSRMAAPHPRLTPTGVGSTVTYHQVVNVLFTMIARIHQPGHPIKNSLRDPL